LEGSAGFASVTVLIFGEHSYKRNLARIFKVPSYSVSEAAALFLLVEHGANKIRDFSVIISRI
jgi:hypothetical protein